MRRYQRMLWAAWLPLLFLFACAGTGSDALREKINAHYQALPAYEKHIAMTLDHGGAVSVYALKHTVSAAGEHRLVITAPEAMRGLTVRVSAGQAEIEYFGTVFAPVPLNGTAVSPILLICDVYDTWKHGLAEFADTQSEGKIRYSVRSNATGDTFVYQTIFDEESAAPLETVCFLDGRNVLRLRYTEEETESSNG